jgi:hypothetical protein
MDALLEALRTAITPTRDRVRDVFAEGGIRWASDDQIIDALSVAAELQRLTDAVMIEAVGEISRRSQERDRDQRLTSRRGCHDVGELVQRATRLGASSAARIHRAAKATMVRQALNGDAMPGLLPAMREALSDGEVGIDGLIAVAGPLQAMSPRVGVDDLRTADALLAAEARGEGPDGAPAACAELLRVQARAWAAYLDQDGAEPREEKALRLRGITLGRARDGVVPITGTLLVEVAAQFERICHAVGSPRVSAEGPVVFRPSDEIRDEEAATDGRTSAQKRHDAFATALFTAASSELLPTIGGAAPTLVVSVREQDLVEGHGWAHLDNGEPVSLAAATHVGCSGVVQRIVQSDDGRILRIGTEERVFNRHQRRAIAPPRRRLPHPRMRSPRGLVRDPPRRRAREGRRDPHRQRGAPLLVPSSLSRPARMAGEDEPRGCQKSSRPHGSKPDRAGGLRRRRRRGFSTSSAPVELLRELEPALLHAIALGLEVADPRHLRTESDVVRLVVVGECRARLRDLRLQLLQTALE